MRNICTHHDSYTNTGFKFPRLPSIVVKQHKCRLTIQPITWHRSYTCHAKLRHNVVIIDNDHACVECNENNKMIKDSKHFVQGFQG